MGRISAILRITANSISNHNSAQDDFDRAAWNLFLDEVKAIMRRDHYKLIGLEIIEGEPLPVIGYGHKYIS